MHALTYVSLIFFSILLCSFSLLHRRIRTKGSPRRTIPGPFQIPWLGRLHDLPISNMWIKFKEWSDAFGPLYFTSMLGTKFIIISDEKVAEDILVRQARFNSDRPNVISVTSSKESYLPLMGHSAAWSRQKRWAHASLASARNAEYGGIIEREVKRWMLRLLQHPADFSASLEDMTSKVMCALAWDDLSQSGHLTESAWGLLTQMSPAGPITNLLTPLWSLPYCINPWKQAEARRNNVQKVYWASELRKVCKRMEQGVQVRSCWASHYLRSPASSLLQSDDEAASAIGMLALVGIFTISGPLHYFLIAMIQHPEWQARCREELDRTCMRGHPTLADSPQLPILRACIKETMRWRPNVPTGVAHEAEADNMYGEYLIEKGTRILPLEWAFLRNPQKYPDPTAFRPERWLDASFPTYREPLTLYPSIVGMSSFGWGRRACLGQNLTQDELLLACGTLLWNFNLTNDFDEVYGRPVPVSADRGNSYLITKPDPFVMKFQVRSEEKARMIQQARLDFE